MTTRILTTDLLIVDTIAYVRGNEGLFEPLIQKYRLSPGSKASISAEERKDFDAAFAKAKGVTYEPGGSSANTCTTLARILGDKVDITFIGVVDDSPFGDIIREGMRSAGVRLISPPAHTGGKTPETAVSYIIVPEHGDRMIVTYPGNMREIITRDYISESIVKQNDIILVQGALWRKLDWDVPDRLLQIRWDNNIELLLAMPTNAKFGEEKAAHFQWLIPIADLVLSNEREIARVTETDKKLLGMEEAALLLETTLEAMQASEADNTAILQTFQQKLHSAIQNETNHAVFNAVNELQLLFRKNILQRHDKPQRMQQASLVTWGAKGGFSITVDEIKAIPPFEPVKKINTLGAGDASFAGYLAGHIQGLQPRESAMLAMAMGAKTLEVNAARHPNPGEALKEAVPTLAYKLGL